MRGEDYITVGFNDDALFTLNKVNVDFPLVGRFNKQNMLIAYGICRQLGLHHDEIVKALENMTAVDGRMQLVSNTSGKPKVIVDYCHTPDALQKAIEALKDDISGKLITVVGCGGDRDKDKRPKMGKIAAELSDFVIVTSDNPRSEKPEDIINDIVAGMDGFDNFDIVVDRSEAIKAAINKASSNDYVLLAGKGHEKYQEVNGEKHHFDDVEEALNVLSS